MGFKVAIAGATGNVGREMLNILEERGFAADEIVPLASLRSVGTEVSYGEPRPGDVPPSLVSAEKTAEIIGWRAQMEFEQGMKELLDEAT